MKSKHTKSTDPPESGYLTSTKPEPETTFRLARSETKLPSFVPYRFTKSQNNILMLGIVHNGIAYSIVSDMLEKKGNSNGNERMDLLDRFWCIFPAAEILYLTGNREFIGQVRSRNMVAELKVSSAMLWIICVLFLPISTSNIMNFLYL